MTYINYAKQEDSPGALALRLNGKIQDVYFSPTGHVVAHTLDSVDYRHRLVHGEHGCDRLVTSLPAIARDLMEDPMALKLRSRLILSAWRCLSRSSGWMADRLGARTVFRTAIAVFMRGSMLLRHVEHAGGFRRRAFVQGMGGAMMLPVGRLVILRSTPRRNWCRR